ncbi:MAG: HipA N-terminal domain-containing protein, partial [Steroidobacteraceae bacterium]
MRTLVGYLNDRRIGTLSEGNDLWNFQYDPAWAAAPNSFDLSPALPRSTLLHQDGGTERPVQWYFDNLLPEEQLREALSKEAKIHGDDAFALLEYLGAESAGS